MDIAHLNFQLEFRGLDLVHFLCTFNEQSQPLEHSLASPYMEEHPVHPCTYHIGHTTHMHTVYCTCWLSKKSTSGIRAAAWWSPLMVIFTLPICSWLPFLSSEGRGWEVRQHVCHSNTEDMAQHGECHSSMMGLIATWRGCRVCHNNTMVS